MSRTCRARVSFAVVLLVLAAGCQDYNFNPVGHCLIQTGTKRVTLSNLSSADVLFVVDDSGSMAAEQQNLAENFKLFIGNLDDANAARASAGLDPFDFHIAVTSTSVFWNFQSDARFRGPHTCKKSSNCGGGGDQLVCCRTDNVQLHPRVCTPGVTACPADTQCRTGCRVRIGDSSFGTNGNYCCGADLIAPAVDTIACGRENTQCGTLEQIYDFAGCGETVSNGVAWDRTPYPQGDFVSWSNASGAVNPRVLHFDKELYNSTDERNQQGFTRQQLLDFFSGAPAGTNGNVVVGTCGSGQEQALQAARLAIEKARQGVQSDTYPYPQTKPAAGAVTATWNPTTRVASSPSAWFDSARADTSKLVVVFVGDEDDCSSPADPSAGVVWDVDDRDWSGRGSDSCSRDPFKAAPDGGKLHPVESFVNFFTGLGRPVAAAFILPAAQESCTLQSCTATGLCCPPLTSCGPASFEGAQGQGVRLLATAKGLAARGVEVVAGSICDGGFGDLLNEIAELVKPPSGLELPGIPAADEVTLLRIASASGTTRKICGRPLAADPSYTLAAAQDTEADWWFTASADPAVPAAGATKFVYINPKGACLANPGETYSADYIGRVPDGGCFGATQTEADEMCRRILGGAADAWTCYGGASTGAETCGNPTTVSPGTCICGSRAQNCPNG